jgi:hypothetical protein
MPLSIKEATIRKGESITVVPLSEMTKKRYRENKEYLFCPKLNCNARIEYASGEKMTYYRTKRSVVNGEEVIEQHIADCPYSVEHDKLGSRTGRFDPNFYMAVSEKHVNDVLKRAYKRYTDPDSGGTEVVNEEPTTKRKSTQSKRDESIVRGKPSLTAVSEDDGTKTKEPSLYQRDINDISERDYGNVRTVTGIMEEIVSRDDYKYIQLKTTDGRSARIYFGEYYRTNNSLQYQQLDFYQQYFDQQKEEGQEVFVACVGDINRDDFDISVGMSNYRYIHIDDKSHYDIIREFML